MPSQKWIAGFLSIARKASASSSPFDVGSIEEMPSLDLAVRHRMIRFAAGVAHALPVEPVGEFSGDIGWSIVAGQAGSMLFGRQERQER
jgi:hypothetical protein